jgi:DNA-binding GntR family transcriptional regulator
MTLTDANPRTSAATLGKIVPVPKSTFRAHIVEQLRRAIFAGDLPPGGQLVETMLAERFGVSRGPLREAIRQLVDEGLLVTIPYTGTYVIEISAADVAEIFSFRIALESFAFEQVWHRRGAEFRSRLVGRHAALTAAIDAQDDEASILAELDLHAHVHEAAGHRLLLQSWSNLRGRLQLYWASHHRAHARRGPRRDSHDSYLAAALGSDLRAMRSEIRAHMRRGAEQTEAFLRSRAVRPGVAA